MLDRGERLLVERSDSRCKSLDESVEFAVGEGPIDVAVALRQFTVDILATRQHFKCASAPYQP